MAVTKDPLWLKSFLDKNRKIRKPGDFNRIVLPTNVREAVTDMKMYRSCRIKVNKAILRITIVFVYNNNVLSSDVKTLYNACKRRL